MFDLWERSPALFGVAIAALAVGAGLLVARSWDPRRVHDALSAPAPGLREPGVPAGARAGPRRTLAASTFSAWCCGIGACRT